MHKCHQCSKEKPQEEFYPHWSSRYDRYYYSWCKECIKRIGRENYRLNRSKKIAYSRAYRKENPQRHKEIMRRSTLKLRIEVLSTYSKGKPVCVCCLEETIEFLAVDHINGGGHQHTTKIKRRGTGFYQWLKKNNYPEGYQILCHNCNMAKGFYGQCPHARNI